MWYKKFVFNVTILIILSQFCTAISEELQCYVCTDCETDYENTIATCVYSSETITTSQEPVTETTTEPTSTFETTETTDPDISTDVSEPNEVEVSTESNPNDGIPEYYIEENLIPLEQNNHSNSTEVDNEDPLMPADSIDTEKEEILWTPSTPPSETTTVDASLEGIDARILDKKVNPNVVPPSVQMLDESKNYGSRYSFIRSVREVKNEDRRNGRCVIASYKAQNDETVVVRGCSMLQEEDAMSHCRDVVGDNHSDDLKRCFVCESNLCNSATSLLATLSLLICTIFILI